MRLITRRFSVLVLGLMLAGPASAAAAPVPFGVLHCRPKFGVRFCPGNGTTTRIPSWDRVPLDVDVTLPAKGKGPFPTIVYLHGWGGDKTEEERGYASELSKGYDNVSFADHGYAVVEYTARGLGRSCSNGSSLPPSDPCARGFNTENDQRFEARDTQYLLGLLVDERIAEPKALGVTGISYGGGRSITLAYLHDRIRCSGAYDTFRGDPCRGKPTNALVRWRSPHGTPLAIAAAWPRWGWTNLAALIPNGRFLDYDPATDHLDGQIGSGSPVGVPLQSVNSFLYHYTPTGTYYERQGGRFDWDITTAYNVLSAGDLFGPVAQRIVNNWVEFHGGFSLGGTPAPMLLENGFDDDLFPVGQALRIYNDVRPRGFVAIQTGDVGHPRATDKARIINYDDAEGLTFFDHFLKHAAGGPFPGEVTAFTQTCPSLGRHVPPDGGPFIGRTWAALHPGVVVLDSRSRQRIAPGSGDPTVSNTFDPVQQYLQPHPQGACTTLPAQITPGTATYELRSRGFTLMGLPTVVAAVAVGHAGRDPGQVVARLWDVSHGRQLLVTRGVYRLTHHNPRQIVFQLNGNGYGFARGHVVKLELLGDDAPYYRASDSPPPVRILSLKLVLPVHERPNRRQILSPASTPLPAPGERGPRTTQGRN
jgi:dienelactone hydrolase